MKKIKQEINQTIKTAVYLIFLGVIVQVTGTTFFGVNLLPLIILVIVAVLLIVGYQSDKETMKWVVNKLKKKR